MFLKFFVYDKAFKLFFMIKTAEKWLDSLFLFTLKMHKFTEFSYDFIFVFTYCLTDYKSNNVVNLNLACEKYVKNLKK